MGTFGYIVLLEILVIVGLYVMNSGVLLDNAIRRAYKGEPPRESDRNLYSRWFPYVFFGILVVLAFRLSWQVYVPFYLLLAVTLILFAATRKRRLDAQSQKNTARLG